MESLSQKNDRAPRKNGALGNKKRELFCRYYANECWGNPLEAFIKAGYKTHGNENDIIAAAKLLEAEDVRMRIAYLREVRSSVSIADDAWIKESLIKIASGAKSDADKIRALANLCKVMQDSKKPKTDKNENDENIEDAVSFEGPEDGSF